LAAKTSAIGTVTSHLIHGLKNPLSGLQTFVSALAATSADAPKDDWEKALASTRRMQTLINQVVAVLREEEGSSQYEVTLAELAEIISSRVHPLTIETGVRFTTQARGEAVLPNRAANLVALILVNLVHNGLQATPKGKSVTVTLSHAEEQIRCEVRDEGPGFPEALRGSLFKPCQSTKEGGSGIGLALSKQLANHLGAALELQSSDLTGCVFALILPASLCVPKTTCATFTFTG
jgi:signal transduction histidine kinase